MKIVHVIATLDPAKGGPQACVVRLAAAEGALGHDVRIVSYRDHGPERRALDAASRVPGLGTVRWHLLHPPGRAERLFGREARSALATVLNGADFVHIHGVWEPILRLAALSAEAAGIPYCVCPHGMLDPWSLAQKSWKKRLALALGYRRMLDRAAFIHALNRDEADLMAPLGLAAPVAVIPNGIFLEELEPRPEPGSFRKTVPALGNRPFVLFLSRLHTKKGLDILADAFARVAVRCPGVDLVVAGPDAGAEVAFAGQIRRHGVSSRVHQVGSIFGATKLAALNDAAAFCLPSRQEGFSVAITEALASGCPVVITKACHFPEVGEADAGFIVDLDPAAVAEALALLLDYPGRASEMGRNGAALVRRRFLWPNVAALALDAYRRHTPSGSSQARAGSPMVPV
jgi:glycosyltransferase involved in cell wall biosynthesis